MPKTEEEDEGDDEGGAFSCGCPPPRVDSPPPPPPLLVLVLVVNIFLIGEEEVLINADADADAPPAEVVPEVFPLRTTLVVTLPSFGAVRMSREIPRSSHFPIPAMARLATEVDDIVSVLIP